MRWRSRNSRTQLKPEKLERVNKRIQKDEYVPPDNAVTYGLNGAPHDELYPGGDLGRLRRRHHGRGEQLWPALRWYVAAMRNRISAQLADDQRSARTSPPPRAPI